MLLANEKLALNNYENAIHDGVFTTRSLYSWETSFSQYLFRVGKILRFTCR